VKELAIAPEADADLIGIYDYTSDTWGLDRADAYLDLIHARINGLLTGRTASHMADDVKPGLRRAVAEGHVVFFREDAARVTVLRVLHQRMDVGRV
jgi:toxin ParE1/3/4